MTIRNRNYPAQLRQCELHITPISSKYFSRSNDTLVCEVSDFNDMPKMGGTPNLMVQPLYNDACDVGLAIRSEHTGREVRFTFTGYDENDGEITGWRYDAIDDAGPIKHVLIIND